jgi:adenylate cyclase
MSFFKELKRRNVFRVGIAYTVATWLLIQVTDTVFPRIGLPDSAVTLVIALLVIGFIPALIVAWAFELTPEGLKREKDVDRTQSIAPKTGKNLDRMIIAGLALIIVGMGIERIWFAGSDEPAVTQAAGEAQISAMKDESSAIADETVIKVQSVAVLPFTAMSSGTDDSYFADGLTEEILNSLARLPELLVTARTSSFHFKDKNLPVPEIAATLGVDHIVEGSVRRSGERVRITAQLIRAEDGFHLWSNTYDRTLEDVFAVQEDIAENIAETLDVVLNENKRKQMSDAQIKNVEAFIAYQKGIEVLARAHSTSDPIELLPEANVYFDQALAIVPSITNAQLERTDLFGHIIYNNAIGESRFTPEELEAALEEIMKGLAQAARYAPSNAQRAYLEAERAEFSENWSSIPANLDRAFDTEECYAVNWVPSLASLFGWAEQVSAHYQRLMRCDPLSGVYVAMGVQFILWAGQAETAIKLSSNYLNNTGFNAWVDDIRFFATLANGSYRDNPGAYDLKHEGSFFQLPRRFYVYTLENEIAKAGEVLELTKSETSLNDETLLLAEAMLGNREAANAYASKMDARFAGPFILAEVVKGCFCGAPFDLEATPNFKKRIEEAGFSWPPASPINYPAKDW